MFQFYLLEWNWGSNIKKKEEEKEKKEEIHDLLHLTDEQTSSQAGTTRNITQSRIVWKNTESVSFHIVSSSKQDTFPN